MKRLLSVVQRALLALASLGWVMALLWAGADVAYAAERAPLSVVVVLDTSGSMAQPGHDPKEISKFAVEVLGHFLDDSDRLGVVPLGGATEGIPLTEVGALRSGLGERLGALKYGGGTPCAERLAAAEAMLRAASPAPGTGSVIFLTDGVCHEGMSGEAQLGARTIQVAQKLRDGGVPLFGVALGAEADVDFVRFLSAGAELEWTVDRVEEARQLPALFARLSAALRHTEARTVSLNRGTQPLELDPYLRSVTLLATADGGPVALRRVRDPGGEAVATRPVEGVFPRGEKRRRETNGYSILKLLGPEAGRWGLDVDARNAPSAIIVYDYDLRAVLELTSKGALRPGGVAELSATLETPSGDPVAAGFLKTAEATLQARGPTDTTWRDLGPMTFDGLAGFGASVPITHLGRHRFRARLRRGQSLDLRSYAEVTAAPGVSLATPRGACLNREGPQRFVAILDLPDGPPPEPPVDTSGLDVRLWARGPGDEAPRPVAPMAWEEEAKAFVGHWQAPTAGAWRFDARLQGGPGVESTSPTVEARRVDVALALDSTPIDFGTVKAGDEASAEAAWTAALSHGLTLTADPSAVELPRGVVLDVEAMPLEPTAAPPIVLTLRSDPGSVGGPAGGQLQLTAMGSCLPRAGLAFTLPIRAEVVPLTWWEKLLRFWQLNRGLVLGLLALLLLLLYLLMVAICAARTHAFDSTLSIARSDRPSDFPMPRRLVDFTGTERRFLVPLRCRSARLYWNSYDADFGATRDPSWYLQARPDGSPRLIVPQGMTAQAAPATTLDFQPVDTPRDMNRGVIYKVGDTYFKLE